VSRHRRRIYNRHRIAPPVIRASSAIEVQGFEQVEATAGKRLLRITARSSETIEPEATTLLLDGGRHRFAPLPAPPDPAGTLRLAYPVRVELLAPSTSFSLELPDGSIQDLPRPSGPRGDAVRRPGMPPAPPPNGRRRAAENAEPSPRRDQPCSNQTERRREEAERRREEAERRAEARRLALEELQQRLEQECRSRANAEQRSERAVSDHADALKALQTLEQANAELRDALAAVERRSDERAGKLTAELQRARTREEATVRTLRVELAEAGERASQMAAAAALSGARAEELEELSRRLENELETARGSLQATLGERDLAQAQLERAQQQLAQDVSQLASLRSTLHELKAHAAEQQTRAAQACEELVAAQAAAESRIGELERGHEAAMLALTTELEHARAAGEQARAQAERLAALEKQLEDTTASLRAAEQSAETSRQRLEERSAEHASEAQALRSELAELRRAHEEAKAQTKATLERERAEARSAGQRAADQISIAEGAVREALEQAASSQREIEALRRALTSATDEAEQQRAAVELERESAQQAAEQAERRISQLTEQLNQLADVREQRDTLQARLALLESELHGSEQRAAEEAARLTAEAALVEERVHSTTGELAATRRRIVELEEIGRLQAGEAVLQTVALKTRGDAEAVVLRAGVERALDDAERARAEALLLRGELDKLTARLAAAERERSDADAEANRRSREVEEAGVNLAAIAEVVSAETARREELQQALSATQASGRELEQRLVVLVEQLGSSVSARAAAVETAAILHADLRRAARRELRQARDRAASAAKRSQAELELLSAITEIGARDLARAELRSLAARSA
jgi:chromosome segregation ATPase